MSGINTKRGPTAPKIARLNLYITEDTLRYVEQLAALRGVNKGAIGRQLLEERIRQLIGGNGSELVA